MTDLLVIADAYCLKPDEYAAVAEAVRKAKRYDRARERLTGVDPTGLSDDPTPQWAWDVFDLLTGDDDD